MSANATSLHPSQICVNVNHYMLKYSLQHGALAYIDKQAIKVTSNDQCKTIQAGKLTVQSI